MLNCVERSVPTCADATAEGAGQLTWRGTMGNPREEHTGDMPAEAAETWSGWPDSNRRPLAPQRATRDLLIPKAISPIVSYLSRAW
jgi:hypothetical protein